FFSSRRRHTRFSRDWSSDVCSSDLPPFRLLFVNTTGALTLDDVTLTGGLAGVTDPGDNGGAVYNLGALTLIDSAITASSANGDESGSASCRERVWISQVAASLGQQA